MERKVGEWREEECPEMGREIERERKGKTL